ncbi:hypothetical protein QQ045_033353 [Rhodiola kirilowii]
MEAGKSDRVHLFSMINDLPTVSETVLGSFEKPSKEKSSATTHKTDTSKSPSGSKMWKSSFGSVIQGFPDETWGVNLPAAEIPHELPEPVLGINFNRDRMPKKEWLTFVAAHSDSWLYSVALFYAILMANFGADKSER